MTLVTVLLYRRPDNQKKEANMLAPRRTHPHLYQINTWPWLDALSSAKGRTLRLADVPDAEWDRLAALGFDYIYLLGIWKRSIAGRHLFRTDPAAFARFDHALPGWTVESVVGSPFSIEDYGPIRFGSWADVDAVRGKLHARHRSARLLQSRHASSRRDADSALFCSYYFARIVLYRRRRSRGDDDRDACDREDDTGDRPGRQRLGSQKDCAEKHREERIRGDDR